MAEKNYKVNEAIEIVYQAPNAVSSLDIRADIYDQNKALFSVSNPLTEVPGTGTYRGSFTPNAVGEWQAVIYKFIDSDNRDGQVTKRYSVGAHDVHSVGEGVGSVASAVADVDADVATLDGKVVNLDGDVAALDTKVTALPDAADVNAEVDTALIDYDAATGAEVAVVDGKINDVQTKANTIETKVDAIDDKVSSLDTPPMVS